MSPDPEYQDWLKAVDRLLIERTGMSHATLADWDWLCAFEDGLVPQEAVEAYFDETDDGADESAGIDGGYF